MSCGGIESSCSIIKIRREDLEFIGVLGEGGFSTVYQAIWKRESGNIHVAVKKIHITNAHDCELELLSQLNHPNVIKFIGIVPDPFDYMLILELCENGSLRSHLDKNGQKPLSSDLLDVWSKQAAKAIEYLHSEKKIIHKDIKSQNYVISSDMVLKLTDFGISKLADCTYSNATASGSVRYKAPELLKESRLSPKSDIFAYAVVLWEMVTGKVPYEGLEYVAIVMYVANENKRPEIPPDCPEYISKLLRRCWLADHKWRPNIHQVLTVLESKDCQSTTSGWNHHHQFGHREERDSPKLVAACAIALNRDDHLAVFDYHTGSTHVYDNGGVIISSFAVRQERLPGYPFIPQPLIAGPNGTFILSNDSHQIEMYGFKGVLHNTFNVLPSGSSAKIGGLTLDMNDQLLVGIYDYKEEEDAPVAEIELRRINFILIMKELSNNKIDVADMVKIPVSIQPRFLAVTPLDSIIVISLPAHISSGALRQSWLQIVDKTGQVLRNLIDSPPGLTRFRATGVCCSSDMIFVTNDNRTVPNEYGVYCFTLSGDYIGCATNDVLNPVGVAISGDGNLMFVAQFERENAQEGQEKHGVKVFRRV